MLLLLAGLLCFLPGVFFLRLALLGRRPENIAATVGTLVKASAYKNVPMKYGGVIKNQTDYVYAYTVNGRLYRRSGRKNTHRRTIPQKVTICYLIPYPRFSGIERPDLTLAWLCVFCSLCPGVTFILIALASFIL